MMLKWTLTDETRVALEALSLPRLRAEADRARAILLLGVGWTRPEITKPIAAHARLAAASARVIEAILAEPLAPGTASWTAGPAQDAKTLGLHLSQSYPSCLLRNWHYVGMPLLAHQIFSHIDTLDRTLQRSIQDINRDRLIQT